ncbi:MAG: abhydrolase domain-containing 18 [Mycobacterium sp.]
MTTAPHVAVDEAVLAVIRNIQPRTAPPDAAHTAAIDMAQAAKLFAEEGWLDEPATYHRTPPPLADNEVLQWGGSGWPLSHETMTFASEFHPRAIEPGADRWPPNNFNDTVSVRMLRHQDSSAPWVVCLHGFGMGSNRFDLAATWATHMHTKLGFNVALPVAPLHGPRRQSGDAQLLSLDLMAVIHGITQAVWDVRRLVSWIRSTTDAPVGAYGISLGGFLATLLAGIEPLDAVVAALPFNDVPALLDHHGPPVQYHEVISSDDARKAFTVISPLALPSVVLAEHRSLFVARADRLIPVEQSEASAEAWRHSHVQTFNTGHVGFTWSRAPREVLLDRLSESLATPRH